jgi:Cu/Ag efflux protein CusF
MGRQYRLRLTFVNLTHPAWDHARHHFPTNAKGILMKIVASLTVAAALGTLLAPAVAQDKPSHEVAASTAPGTGTVKEIIRATGVVQAIDLEKRHVTIKDAHDRVHVFGIGPEARNLDKLKVGDRVNVRYAQALTLTLMKGGDDIRSRVESPPTGERTAGGGVVGQKVEVTANVVAVNKKAHMITLQGTEYEVDLHVYDPEQLKMIKVGDQVHAVYTEAVALSIEPAKK